MPFTETTNEENQAAEVSSTTPDEILELKKKLAEEFVDKLSEKNSDSISSIEKGVIKNYLVDEDTPIDTFFDNILGGFLPTDIKKYREMFSNADTKSKLEELRKTIFNEIGGGTEQASTDNQESDNPVGNSNEASEKTKEDKEEVVDNNGEEEQPTDSKNEQPTDSKVESNNGIIEKACQVAVDIANDNSYGYEWGGTGNKNGRKGFDCQGFVRHCYIETGINVPPSGGCGTMKRDFEKVGFECITFNKNEKLKPGDILVDPKKHTELCISEDKIAGAHSNKDKKAGDSGGEEISVRNIKSSLRYRNPQYILRYKGGVA